MAVEALLSQATGYGVICGLSVLFCLIIIVAVRTQKKYLSEDSEQTEMFMVANRTVGRGLTCSAVFSSWMWINESVFSAAYTYKWGVALPVWWASGLSFQIALMALMGIIAKLRVPYAHTSLEFLRKRYGRLVHIIFITLNLINNIFGCGSMILAGAQLVTGMTGMHVIAAMILIPAGVVLYTAVGGLKATFLTDFVHTTIALILLTYFSLSVLTHEQIGGPKGLYDKVKAADWYIDGNYEGSLLSFKSRPAILFGLVLKFGNLALVMMDTAFWQKAFASEVSATVPGYDLASLAIIAVPWCTGTIIGLSARAIEKTPVWYTYPEQLTLRQVNQGLVMPYVLRSLLGTGATSGLLVLIFMAITSTISSSMIAVSSIISLDLYRTYINPRASNRKTLQVSHGGVVFHGAFMAGFAIMLQYAGATSNWATYFRPIIACPGIFPTILSITWSGQTRLAAILAPILGLCSGLATWLTLSWHWAGAININTTQQQLPGLYGAIVSFFSPLIYSVVISLLKPSRFDWRVYLQIDLIEDNQSEINKPSPSVSVTAVDDGEQKSAGITSGEKQVVGATAKATNITDNSSRSTSPDLDHIVHPFDSATLVHIKHWRTLAAIFFVVNVLTTIVCWPLPLYRDWIFTKSFFAGWVVVAIIWQWFAIGAVIIYPVFDGRAAIMTVFNGVLGRGRTRAS